MLAAAVPLGCDDKSATEDPLDAATDTSGDIQSDSASTDDTRGDTADSASDTEQDSALDVPGDTRDASDGSTDSGDASDTSTDADDASDAPDTSDVPPTDGDMSDVADACDPPPRIEPDTASSAGYDVIWARGSMYPIGALEWWLVLDGELWVGFDYSRSGDSCEAPFELPPVAPGTYDATVVYGFPTTMPPPPAAAEGTLTIEAATEPWSGATGCQSDDDCTEDGTRCEIGLGFCVREQCPSVYCPNDEPCDPLEGCGPAPPACTSDADCTMIYSSCGCMAVHDSDPRVQAGSGLTKCELGACRTCFANNCTTAAADGTTVQAACDTASGECIEVRK